MMILANLFMMVGVVLFFDDGLKTIRKEGRRYQILGAAQIAFGILSLVVTSTITVLMVYKNWPHTLDFFGIK